MCSCSITMTGDIVVYETCIDRANEALEQLGRARNPTANMLLKL